MVLERFFLAQFRDQDFIQRSKTRIFFYYNLFMLGLLVVLLVLYGVMPLDKELAVRGIAGGSGIIVLILASLFALRSGNLNVAVWVYALPTILAVAGLRVVNSRTAPETAFSTYIFYMPYLIVYVAVFAKRFHVIIVSVFFLAANWLVWFIARAAAADMDNMLSTGIINSSMGILTTAVISYSLISLIGKYMQILEADARTAAEKLERIRAAMAVAHDGLHVGSKLVAEAESMESATGTVEKAAGDIRQDVGELQKELDSSRNANQAIMRTTASLTQSTERYQTVTLQASSAVEEMTAAIESITAVSARNRDGVERLVQSISGAVETMESSAKAIQALTNSSASLQDVVNVIGAISGQTNLLAMNAAIEAAHAGDSGKGFAVVAEEIRRLSEETASNSRTISDGLSRFFTEINSAAEANRRIEAAFAEIGQQIETTKSAFGEILSGMRELSTGTADINAAVSEVVGSSRHMNSSIGETHSMVNNNMRATEAVSQKTAQVLNRLDTISAGFTDILHRAIAVRELGQRSDAVIRGLDEAIRAIEQ